ALSGGDPTATLSGGSMTVANGVASFTTLKVNKVGTLYKMTPSTATLNGAASNNFDINTFGPATQLVITTQPPASSAVNAAFTTTVKVEDASGNVVTNDSTSVVTLALSGG